MLDRQLAIALQHLREDEEVPKVIAKGRGQIAEKILQLAEEQKIPVHQDTDLAEVLFRLDIGETIPPELYKVIAEILSFIYIMNEKKKNSYV